MRPLHHLVIRPRSAITACGIPVDVYFPGTGTAITFRPVEDRIECTVDEAQASCLKCHTASRVTATRVPKPLPAPEYEPRGDHPSAADQRRAKLGEHVTVPAFVPDGHRTFERVVAIRAAPVPDGHHTFNYGVQAIRQSHPSDLCSQGGTVLDCAREPCRLAGHCCGS